MITTQYYSITELRLGEKDYFDLELNDAYALKSNKLVMGSGNFPTYEECAKHALNFINVKLKKLGSEFKIYFSKNQFSNDFTDTSSFNPDFDETEIIKLYLATNTQDLTDALLITKIYFEKQDYFNSTTIH